MEWREAGGRAWLRADLPGAAAAFTTRAGGSAKEDHAGLAAALGFAPGDVARGRQVHGTGLGRAGDPEAPEEADGRVVDRPGLAGLVYVADCLPVALAGLGGVAILHCGWRGLAAGILAHGAGAVDATHAAIGPGIGPCCYEVGEEVLGAFAGLGQGVASGRMLDLPEVARRRLRQAGVGAVESAGLCTSCEADLFFSHRRDGGPGRQTGVAWLEPGGRAP